jgi:RNA polymerase sigma factor (sigma-70 family)
MNRTEGVHSNRYRFATTHWSRVLAAGRETTQSSQAALDTLCRTYWYPLYVYVRRTGRSPEDAQDLTQAFFVRLFEKHSLALADQHRGRFRSFLLSSLKNFLINEHAKSKTVRRGGGRIHFSIDGDQAEERYCAEPADDLTPDKLFEKRWATTLLEQALETLRQEYAQAGTQALFERLKEHLWGDKTMRYAEIAETFGMKEGSARAAALRLRRRFGQTVRALIADTVATPEEVEEELNALLKAFGS